MYIHDEIMDCWWIQDIEGLDMHRKEWKRIFENTGMNVEAGFGINFAL